MQKYYYQEGMCETLHYRSLNPILYEKAEDNTYAKVQMACSAIEEGKCDKKHTCQLLLDAPATMQEDGRILTQRKL